MTILIVLSFALCVAAAANVWSAYGIWRAAQRNHALCVDDLARVNRLVHEFEARLAALDGAE